MKLITILTITALTGTMYAEQGQPQPRSGLMPLIYIQPFEEQGSPDEIYNQGTRAMNDHRWQDAVTAFDKVIEGKGKRSDAALYWKAYSLQKLGNTELSTAACAQLRSQFERSSWNTECSALKIRTNRSAGGDVGTEIIIPPMPPEPPSPHIMINRHMSDGPLDADSELKLLALNSVLQSDPSRALPVLRSILSSPDKSIALKKQAIFVLAQSKNPEAQSILHDAVVGKMDVALQRQAIQMISVFQGKKANDTLVEVYKNSSDQQIKRAVISGLFVSQDAPRLVELARGEKDMELKRRIVSQLAMMHDKAAEDYMLELLK